MITQDMKNIKNNTTQKSTDRRSEYRNLADLYYSVELSIQGMDYTYQFKLRDISTKGMCILIKDASNILSYIKVDDIVNMKYYSKESITKTDTIKTKIKHITKGYLGQFKGHYMVGLEVI